ncbi:MAG: MBL fold metallo-hydrolase [Candidatus Thorarchaeota archaeon]
MPESKMNDKAVMTKISDHFYLIRGKNRSRFPEGNCVLVDDETLTLIDAGASIDNIKRSLMELGYDIEDIDRIVLSHFHIDHKGYANEINEVASCEVMCHPLADKGVMTFEGMVDYYGIDEHRYYDDWAGFLKQRLPHVIREYEITSHFEDNIPINCGETQIIPLYTPGHTIDHTCFGLNGYDDLLLVDIDLTGFGPWYGNKVSDIDDFRASIRRIIKLNPKMVVSGHLQDPIVEDIDAKLKAYLNKIDKRDDKILRLVSEGYNTVKALANLPTIYPRIPRDLFLVFEEFMLKKHVDSLKRKGLLSVSEEGILGIESQNDSK